MSLGCFDCTEPSVNTSLNEMQDEQGACALVRGSSSTSNLLEPHYCIDSKVDDHLHCMHKGSYPLYHMICRGPCPFQKIDVKLRKFHIYSAVDNTLFELLLEHYCWQKEPLEHASSYNYYVMCLCLSYGAMGFVHWLAGSISESDWLIDESLKLMPKLLSECRHPYPHLSYISSQSLCIEENTCII